MAAEDLDCLVDYRDRVSGAINRSAFEVGVKLRDVFDGDALDDPTPQARFRVDQAAEHLTYLLATNQRFARPSNEVGLRFIQRHDRIEIASFSLNLFPSGTPARLSEKV